MLSPIILRQGVHIFKRSCVRKAFGPRRYPGTASDICNSIVTDCWNGAYFQTSTGNFNHFYSRDFGWCTESLLDLGKAKEVKLSLQYALNAFRRSGIKTAISRSGIPFDFPNVYSPDSVAYFFRSIYLLGDKTLISSNRSFLERELNRFTAAAIDPKTCMIRRHSHFSSMKDYSIRDSSCYDLVMAAMLSDIADKMGLDNPLRRFNLVDNLENFWDGAYYKDDLSSDLLSADANLYQFWFGLEKRRSRLSKVIASIHKAGLDCPFPLKYSTKNSNHRQVPFSFVAKDWELDAVWAHMGMVYIDVLHSVDKKQAQEHLDRYKNIIEHYKTFYEVYTPDGARPYRSLFYHADEGMLWAAQFLDLQKKLTSDRG